MRTNLHPPIRATKQSHMDHAREQKTNCKIIGQHSTCGCYPALLYFCHGHQVISPYLQVGSMCAKNGDQVGKWPCEELWQQARAPRQHLPAQHRSHLKGWKQKTALKGGCWVAHDLPLLIMPEDLDNSGDSSNEGRKASRPVSARQWLCLVSGSTELGGLVIPWPQNASIGAVSSEQPRSRLGCHRRFLWALHMAKMAQHCTTLKHVTSSTTATPVRMMKSEPSGDKNTGAQSASEWQVN